MKVKPNKLSKANPDRFASCILWTEKSLTMGRRAGIPVNAVGFGDAAFVENCPECRVERSD